MNKVLAVFMVAGVCAAVDAAPRLIWQASIDNGATWSAGSGLRAMVGTTIKVRGIVDWTGTTAYGLSSLQQQVFIDNYDAGDVGAQVDASGVGNRIPPFAFGTAALGVRVTGTTQRIVALGNNGVEGNFSNAQGPPATVGTNYSRANPAAIFTFDYTIGRLQSRTLTIRSNIATLSGLPSAIGFHANEFSSSTTFRETGVVEPVSIEIIPDTDCVISEQPDDAALFPGGIATFHTAFPQNDASYQWRKDGVDLIDSSRISGTQSPTLLVSDVRSDDQGAYDCRVTSIRNPATTRPAILSCKSGFAEHPQGGTYRARDVVQLHAAATQPIGVTLRWRKDGAVLFNSLIYSGVTTPTLTIHTFDPTQSGNYTLAATNACGTSTSEIAPVVIFCPGDFNGDEFIDFADFDAFVVAFETNEPRGDFNGDGFLDYVDFDDFVAAFESGC